MARIRSVKPELRTSQLVASWPIEVRYFWVLLWGYLDDYGRGVDSPKAIAGDCFPWDDKIMPATVDRWLRLMTTKTNGEPGPVCRYEVAGKPYLHSVNWKEHQRPNRPTKSRLPPCPVHDELTEPFTESFSESDMEPYMEEVPEGFTESFMEPLHVGAGEQGSRVDGAGEQRQPRAEPLTERAASDAGSRPLLRSALIDEDPTDAELDAIADLIRRERRPRNLGGLLRAIVADGEAPDLLRQVRAERKLTADTAERQRLARERAETNRIAIDACRMCDDRGYRDGRVCAHDPGAADRARRGAAAARAALHDGAA